MHAPAGASTTTSTRSPISSPIPSASWASTPSRVWPTTWSPKPSGPTGPPPTPRSGSSTRRRRERRPEMRFGYWLPVFGGWLRNVANEDMPARWDYVRRLALRSEELGYDLTLVAELNLNDIKGVDAPSLDAWSTAAAVAAVTTQLEIMVA